MGYITDLTDEQWAIIQTLLPEQEGVGRRRTVDLRRIIDALLYQVRAGCQWRLLPNDFPPSGTVRYYFDKWNQDGTLLEIHDCLRRQVRLQQGRNAEPSASIIDSQSKQPKSVANAATMRGKKSNGRKRHIAVDTNGHLLTACIHAANISDRDGAQMLLNDLIDVCPSVRRVW